MKNVRSMLFRVPGSDRELRRQAEALSLVVDKEYMLLTGKPNTVVVVQNYNGWWELVSNDPEFDTAELVANIRKWDGSPLMTGVR